MSSPQIILDTNVVVSALRSSRGASAAIVASIGTEAFHLNVSVALAMEYEELLKRQAEQVEITLDEVEDLVSFICANATRRPVRPVGRPLLTDPDDDLIADLALSFTCEFVVTHNIRHLQPLGDRGIRIVTPGQFLAIMRSQR